MRPLETITHSFIVKIWLEEAASEPGTAVWRGHITHVPSGERQYVTRLSEIDDFVLPYLKKMGVKLGPLARLKLWLRRNEFAEG